MAFSNTAHSYMPMAGMKSVLDKMKDENEENENEENEEEKKTVKKRKRVTLDKAAFQEKLTSPDGVQRLYSDFRDIKFKGKGREAEDLRLLMRHYEEWAYKLVPVLSFDDVIQKVESVGNTYFVQQALDKFREVESEKKDPRRQEELAAQAEADRAKAAAEAENGAASHVKQQESEKTAGDADQTPATHQAGSTAQPEPSQQQEDDEGYDDPEAYGYDPADDYEEEDIGAEYVDEDAFEEAPREPVPPRQPSPPPPEINEELREKIERNRRLAMERLAAARAGGSGLQPRSDAPASAAAAQTSNTSQSAASSGTLRRDSTTEEAGQEGDSGTSNCEGTKDHSMPDARAAAAEEAVKEHSGTEEATAPESTEMVVEEVGQAEALADAETGEVALSDADDRDKAARGNIDANAAVETGDEVPLEQENTDVVVPANKEQQRDAQSESPVEDREQGDTAVVAGGADGETAQVGETRAADVHEEQGAGGGDDTEDEAEQGEQGAGQEVEQDEVDELELVEDFV